MRKLKVVFSVFLVLCLALAFTACGKDEPEVKITVRETLELEAGEEKPLEASVEGTENALGYKSSDEAVATVSEAGVVRGISAGTAEITVSVGDVKAICRVTVTKRQVVAALAFLGESPLQMWVDDESEVAVSATVDGAAYAGTVTYEWTVSEPDKLSITLNPEDSARATLKSLAAGTPVVTVSAVIEGVPVSAELSVIAALAVPELSLSGEGIILDSGSYKASLALSDDPDRGDLPSEIIPAFTVMYKGQALENPAVSMVSANEEVAKCEDGKIMAAGPGSAVVTVSYEDQEVTILVDVKKPERELDNKLLLETMRPEKSFDPGQELQGTVTGVRLYLDGYDIEIFDHVDENGMIVMNGNAPYSFTEMGEDMDIAIETDKVMYRGKADVYSAVIRNRAELELLTSVSTDEQKSPYAGQGYYIQDADIDFEGDNFKGFGYYDDTQGSAHWVAPFSGIYDGRGHMISNYHSIAANGSNHNAGFFANMTDTAVVRNLILYNATVNGCSGLISTMFEGTIENIVVYGTLRNGAGWAPGSLTASKITKKGRINNVLGIYYNEECSDMYKDTYKAMLPERGKYGGIVAGLNWADDDSNLTNLVAVNLDEHFPGDYSAVGHDKLGCRYAYYADTDSIKTFNGMNALYAWKNSEEYNHILDWIAPFMSKLAFVDVDYDLKDMKDKDLTLTLPFSDVSEIMLIDVVENSQVFNFSEGTVKEYAVSGNKLTVPAADLTEGNHILRVKSEGGALYHANIAVYRSISTPEELNNLSKYVDEGIRYFRQTADIDYAGGDINTGMGAFINDEWHKEFNGVYNGMGHIIANGVIKNAAGEVGPSSVFGQIKGEHLIKMKGLVENIIFADITLPGNGSVIVANQFSGTIRNILAYGTHLGDGSVVNKNHASALIADRTTWSSRIYNVFAIAKSVSFKQEGNGGLVLGWNRLNAGNGAYLARIVGLNLDPDNRGIPAVSNDSAEKGYATIAANSDSDHSYDTAASAPDRATPDNIKTLESIAAFDDWRRSADYKGIAEWAFNYGYVDRLVNFFRGHTTMLSEHDFDLSDGNTFKIELPVETDVTAVKAANVTLAPENYAVDGAVLTITEAGVGEILGDAKYGDFDLVISTDIADYEAAVHIITKILRTKEDAITMMALARGDQAVPENGNSVATEQKAAQPDYYDEADGYFVLAANIDMEGDVIRFCHKDGEFKGIIDGRGHAIFNIGSLEYKLLDDTKVRLTNANAGIFGQLSGTLKNIALVNVVCGKDEASPVDEECHRNIAIAYKVLPSAVIENVYLTFVQSEDSYGPEGKTLDGSGAMGEIQEGATLAKIVIEAMNKPNNMRARGDNNHEIINTIGTSTNADKTTIAGICGECGDSLPVGTKFRCYQDINASTLNLAGYDEEYWDISRGIPTFKGVMEDMAAETDLRILGMPVLFTATGDGTTANVSKSGLANMPAGTNRFYMNSTSKYMMSYRFPEGETVPDGAAVKRNYIETMANCKVGDTFTVIAYNPHVDGIEFSIKLTVVE